MIVILNIILNNMGNFINKLSKYQIIPRELIFDNTMSDRARFIYCYMASKPDGWEFYLNPMAKEIGYSVETLRKYINELIKNGWLIKGEQKNEGTFGAVTYTLNSTKKPDTEKIRHGKNPTQYIIDSLDITDESFKKDKDKSLSKSNYQQGCGTSLSPSVAPQHLSAASSGVSSPCSSDDAFAPLTFEEEEATNKLATACGVNVNPLQTPLPPLFPTDADAEPSGDSDAESKPKSRGRSKSKPADTTDYDAIVEFWNKTNPNLRQVRNLNNKRKKQIRKLIAENDATIDDVFNAMRAISVSSFCNGSHDWRANFDWFIADTKSCFNRLLEGAFFSSQEERSEYARIATGTNANFEPKLPNGWDRERYDMYIRNGFEITEDGKLYKNGKLYK